jgi:hypothetical protein
MPHSDSGPDQGSAPNWHAPGQAIVLFALPVAIGIATSKLPDWWPLWAAAAVLAVVITAYLTRDAPMSRLRLGGAPVGYLVAAVMLLAFLLTLPLAAQHERNTWLVLLPTMLLWASALTALQPVTHTHNSLAAFFVASSAFSEAALLFGAFAIRDGETLGGVAGLLSGVAVLLFGVAVIRDGDALFGVAELLLGVAGLLFGVAVIRDGDALFGVAMLLSGVGGLLFGVAVIRDGDALFGVAGLLFGVAGLLLGVAVIRDGDTLFGVAGLLFGVAGLLLGVAGVLSGVAESRDGDALFGVTALLLGVAGLLSGVGGVLSGVAVIRDGDALFGVATLLFGVATLYCVVGFGVGRTRLGGVGRDVTRWAVTSRRARGSTAECEIAVPPDNLEPAPEPNSGG